MSSICLEAAIDRLEMQLPAGTHMVLAPRSSPVCVSFSAQFRQRMRVALLWMDRKDVPTACRFSTLIPLADTSLRHLPVPTIVCPDLNLCIV
jgi:hypothetical protein